MNIAYVQRSLEAAFRLAARDSGAWQRFDLSTQGFFLSFSAILIVAPMSILFDLFAWRLAQSRAMMEGSTAPQGSYGYGEMVFSTIALAFEWMLFPLAMILLCRFLGLTQRYAQMVIAHNWGRVVIECFNAPAIILFSLGLISHQFAVDLLFLSLGLTLYYRFYIAQTALEIGWSLAMAISILELLLTLFFAIAVSNSAYLWLPAS